MNDRIASINNLDFFRLENIPFAFLSSFIFLTGNIFILSKGMLVGDSRLSFTLYELKTFEPFAWQSLAASFFLLNALITSLMEKHPFFIPRWIMLNTCIANTCFILSGFTQEAFWFQAAGIAPSFLAISLLFRGNVINNEKLFFYRYPVFVCGMIFALKNASIVFNTGLSGDYGMLCVAVAFIFANLAFAMTDVNFKHAVLRLPFRN